MGRKSILKTALTALFFIFACYATFNAFYYPNLGNLDSIPVLNNTPAIIMVVQVPPVKVYMYNLPRKFTYGVIESYTATLDDQGQGQTIQLPKYPANQYSAEWYLFADLNRPERFDSDSGHPIVRVLDPEKADLFYVPFFSSLSLVVNLIKSASGSETAVYSTDEATQEGLIEWLQEQVYWKRNNGWDHIYTCEHPNSLNKVVDRVKNGILLVSDFWGLSKYEASLVKDVILPYSHRIKSFDGEVGVESRKSLLFFMGNCHRKEGGKILNMLFEILKKEKDVIIKHEAELTESGQIASRGMHASKFCLHPAGDTPSASACRLFDAIVSLCIPIIVSDYIELPFEDVINYRKIAIFVDTNTAVKPGFLVNLLRKQISTERIVEFQKEMKKVRHYFEYDNPNGTVNEIWRQVSLKLPLIKLMSNRDKRLVKRDLTAPDCSCLCSNQPGSEMNIF